MIVTAWERPRKKGWKNIKGKQEYQEESDIGNRKERPRKKKIGKEDQGRNSKEYRRKKKYTNNK